MAKRDYYHDVVRRALEADGWIITHDPLTLEFGTRNVFVDLGAEAPLAAEKAGRKIAVEVKSFLGKSEIVEMERALGQFVLYRHLMETQYPDHALFLALPKRAYASVFDTTEGQEFARASALRFLVISDAERIEKWVEPNTQA